MAFSSASFWLASTSTTRHRRIGGPIGLLQTLVVTLLFGVFFANGVLAIERIYCSSENTAADQRPMNYSIYQSEGNCYEKCIGKTAYGVLLAKNCWCTNYAPLETEIVDLEDCSDSCPGFPSDRCGNFRKKLYNYIALPDVAPSSRTDLPSSTSAPEPTDAPGNNPAPTPIISITTILGTQQTVTITPPSATGSSVPMESGSFTDNAGRVAGLVVGIILGLLLILALVFFFIRKRRNDRRKSLSSTHSNPEMGMSGSASPVGGGSASPNNRPRSTSTLGLVGPFEKGGTGAAVTTTEQERMTDQRLDPGQIWMRFDHDNSSRVSVRSLQDNYDYSRRVLKLTNPDG